ncbi:hypothetical protein P4475_17275 [Halalkalibacterium halodurans]|uniref:hypothetical protein n=1 Tax=Halalkalibacterium halodurans TaxID=86665 RepID=UPI002E24BA3A|nr:hypothetical protein [Halalkalibacterium halodurans]
MDVKIHIHAPELSEAINNLAKALNSSNLSPAVVAEPEKQELQKADKPTEETPVIRAEGPPEEEQKTEPTRVTLDVVRAKLAEISKAGKQAEAKALIQEFGAKRLTEVDEKDYPALLAKAEELL